MKALVLAAGMGIRLRDMTTYIPKALVELNGVPLIDRILGFLDHPEVTDIAVVGGCHSDLLFDHIKGKNIAYFVNPDYRDGNIFTLQSALEFLDDDFLMTNVDHIYPKSLLDHIIINSRGITAMCDFDRELVSDDMKVKLNENGRLKKISKQLCDYDGGYIGMTFCSRDMLKTYKEGVKSTIDIYGRSSCVEFILGHLAANDVEINICDTSGVRWMEIDTPEDHRIAEDKIRKDNNEEAKHCEGRFCDIGAGDFNSNRQKSRPAGDS